MLIRFIACLGSSCPQILKSWQHFHWKQVDVADSRALSIHQKDSLPYFEVPTTTRHQHSGFGQNSIKTQNTKERSTISTEQSDPPANCDWILLSAFAFTLITIVSVFHFSRPEIAMKCLKLLVILL